MKLQCLLFSTSALIIAPMCSAQSVVPVCPPTLAESTPAPPPNSHWQGLIYMGQGTPKLATIMVFDGHPREMASLVPDESTSSKEAIAVWRFRLSDSPRGIWIACTYTNTNAMFAMRLPSTVRECRLTQHRAGLGKSAAFKSFRCQ